MKFPHCGTRQLRRRGSILLSCVMLMVITGFIALSFIAYLNHTAKEINKLEEEIINRYSSEGMVDRVAAFATDPDLYTGPVPPEYAPHASHPPTLYLPHPEVAPSEYEFFEPYIASYALDASGNPLYIDGELAVTQTTYFADLEGTAEEISKTSKIPTCDLEGSWLDAFTVKGPDGKVRSRIKRVRLINPKDFGDAAPSPWEDRIVAKVVTIAESGKGEEITTAAFLVENPNVDFAVPGPIVSEGAIKVPDFSNVAWGPVYSTVDIRLPDPATRIPRHDPGVAYDPGARKDRWFAIRTSALLRSSNGKDFADGREKHGFAKQPTSTDLLPLDSVPFFPATLYTDKKGKSPYEGLDRLVQRQDLVMPQFSYHDLKNMVQKYNLPYYFTYTDGKLYGVDRDPTSPTYGRTVGRSFEQWFHRSPTSSRYTDPSELIVFIDSIPTNSEGKVAPRGANGVPVINSTYYPRPEESSFVEIKIKAKDLHTRGVILAAANLKLEGNGTAPSSASLPSIGSRPERPDGASASFPVTHNGLIVSWGSVVLAGNRSVFGAIVAEKKVELKQSARIYYNHAMAKGDWLNFHVSPLRRVTYDIDHPATLWQGDYDLNKDGEVSTPMIAQSSADLMEEDHAKRNSSKKRGRPETAGPPPDPPAPKKKQPKKPHKPKKPHGDDYGYPEEEEDDGHGDDEEDED